MNLTMENTNGGKGQAHVRIVKFVNGTTIIVPNPNHITEAIVGVCIYQENGENVLHPWHKIDRILRVHNVPESVAI